jgi:hypothetical protein
MRVATYPPEGLGNKAGGDHELVACTVDGISGVCELAMESNTGTLSLRSDFDPERRSSG